MNLRDILRVLVNEIPAASPEALNHELRYVSVTGSEDFYPPAPPLQAYYAPYSHPASVATGTLRAPSQPCQGSFLRPCSPP